MQTTLKIQNQKSQNIFCKPENHFHVPPIFCLFFVEMVSEVKEVFQPHYTIKDSGSAIVQITSQNQFNSFAEDRMEAADHIVLFRCDF